ncbi:MAG: RagB/SusD family nutrient uptake outer membrane protein [Bacteroidota bacterium]
MKNIWKIFVLVVLLSSCTDLKDQYYDRLPADKYPENALQIALLPAPVYSGLQGFLDGSGWWFCQELTSDEMVGPTRNTDWDDGGKWRVLHEHTWTNTTEAINNMWSPMYGGIAQANKLVELLETYPKTSAVMATIAQVKIMRAFYYYVLIDNYGDVPYVTSFANADPKPFKTTRAEIFNKLVGETGEIEGNIKYLLPSNSKTSVTKGMAFSLLAKLYLNAEVYTGTPEWVKAEAACDSVIALGQYGLEGTPLAPFVTENSGSLENIFTIPYDENTYKGNNLHMRTLHYLSNLTYDMTLGPWNGFCAMEDHYNTYEDIDLRKAGFMVGQQFTSSGTKIYDLVAEVDLVIKAHLPALKMDATFTKDEIRNTGARVIKFEIKKGANDNLSNDFPIFRYADILLMKAEAMIRQSKNGDEYVNQIRTRAGVSTWTGVTNEQLLAERGREMFWEGHRRQDLIRFGEFNKAWWEKLASTPDRNTFPIPQWAIDANENLAK